MAMSKHGAFLVKDWKARVQRVEVSGMDAEMKGEPTEVEGDAHAEIRKYRKCPHCGCDTFVRKVCNEVRIIDVGDALEDDPVDGETSEYWYSCAECGRDVAEHELER